MDNIQRLRMEIKDITIDDAELIVYLSEHGLQPHEPYNATSNINKRGIYSCALQVLESIANNPTMMSAIKIDDMTVSTFHENLMARIDQLERKIRSIPNSDGNGNSSIFMLYV